MMLWSHINSICLHYFNIISSYTSFEIFNSLFTLTLSFIVSLTFILAITSFL